MEYAWIQFELNNSLADVQETIEVHVECVSWQSEWVANMWLGTEVEYLIWFDDLYGLGHEEGIS